VIKDEFEAYVLATNDANNGTEIITKHKFFRDNLKYYRRILNMVR
jgi:hypothetical protein